MANLDRATADTAAERLAHRIRAERERLAERWLDRLNARLIDHAPEALSPRLPPGRVPELIGIVADHLYSAGAVGRSADLVDMREAAELAELRYAPQATPRQLLDEYATLSDVLQGFIESEAARVSPPLDTAETIHVLHRVEAAIRTLERQTIDSFVTMYTQIIERQTQQLRGLSRLVSREIRRPLGVLQVVARMLRIEAGDIEAIRVSDIFERSLNRLIEVTARLERDARLSRATDLVLGEQRVDLSAIAADIADQLDKVAIEHGVQVRVEENLPVLRMDHTHAELVFLNLLANGIKHSDSAKPKRFVEVINVRGRLMPTVMVRDNGVGIDAPRRQQIFRELDRGHAQRAPEMASHGLGIGFAVVRQCMDAAGGNVHVESREREGTTVTLTWPSLESSDD